VGIPVGGVLVLSGFGSTCCEGMAEGIPEGMPEGIDEGTLVGTSEPDERMRWRDPR
jgi:hypothetical protein